MVSGRQYLPFRGNENHSTTAELTLANKTTKRVGYKIKSNQHRFIKVAPKPIGIIAPGEKFNVELTLDKGFDWSCDQITLLLQSAYLGMDIPIEGLSDEQIWGSMKDVCNTELEGSLVVAPKEKDAGDNLATVFVEDPDDADLHQAKVMPPRIFQATREEIAGMAMQHTSNTSVLPTKQPSAKTILGGMPRPFSWEMVTWVTSQPQEVLYPISYLVLFAALGGVIFGVLLAR